MKRSAGIVAYKIEKNEIFIFLAHMGGPYWQGTNKWSILKGELKKGEKAENAAIREFEEECGQKVTFQNLEYLHTEKQKSRKLVTFFCAETEINPENCFSNTFQKEFPKGSGNFQEFPEMDSYRWVPLEEAKEIILSGQRRSLRKLENRLKKRTVE